MIFRGLVVDARKTVRVRLPKNLISVTKLLEALKTRG